MARENVEVFMDVWKALDQDVTALAQEVAEMCRNQSKPIANSYVTTNAAPELNVIMLSLYAAYTCCVMET